jgi:hypothetical protein
MEKGHNKMLGLMASQSRLLSERALLSLLGQLVRFRFKYEDVTSIGYYKENL